MKRNRIALFTIAVIALCGCKAPVTHYYLKDMEVGVHYPGELSHEGTVMVNDRLHISVTCKKPELAIPFNSNSGVTAVSDNGSAVSVPTGSNNGYRVDKDGNIAFPVLGSIHIEGMKASEVKKLIEDKIIEGGYIKDPVVAIDFLNFHYTVVGATGAGVITVETDKITLIDAIAKAGDLALDARMDRVGVIREENGGRTLYMHDLGSKEVFNSPCFYLQQNDIIYVEPEKRKRGNAQAYQIAGMGLSALSCATTIVLLIKQYGNK